MKNRPYLRSFRRTSALILAGSIAALLAGHSAQAADQTWDGGSLVNGNWSTTGNWVGDPTAPGSTVFTTSTDVATFNAPIANTWGNTSSNFIAIDSGRNIGGISFGNAAGNYFIGANADTALKLSSGGTIQVLNTLTATNAIETINAPLQIQGAGGTYTFANNSANGAGAGAGTLNFGGGITGGAAGATVLTLRGSNKNVNSIVGFIANGSATSLAITKQDAGTWQLSGANTYTGATTISAGILRLNSSAALGDATSHTSGVTVSNGAALDLGSTSQVAASAIALNLNGTLSATVGALTSSGTGTWAGTVTLQTASSIGGTSSILLTGPVVGAVGLTKVGTGSLTLSGATNGTTTTTIDGGILQIGAGGTTGALGSGVITINSTGTLAFNRSDTVTQGSDFFGGLGGNGGVTQNGGGSGILVLNQANSYLGRTTVNGGTLRLDVSAAPSILVLSSTLTLGGGTLQLTGTGTQIVAGLTTTVNTGSRILLGANQTLTLGALSSAGLRSSLNFNTTAGGANGATVGSGKVVLTGLSSGVAINSGFTVTDVGGFGLAMVNASAQVVRKTNTALMPVSGAIFSNDYRIDNNPGSASTAGSSLLTVSLSSSTKSITVDTTATGGTLTLASGVLLSNNTWNFGSRGSSSNTYVIGGSTGGAGIRSLGSGDQIDINNYNTSPVSILSPILAFGSNAVTVKGTGTTIFGGANTYTGSTVIRGGTLEVAPGGSITHTTSTLAVGSSIGENGTLNLTGGTVSSSSGNIGAVAGSSGTATVSAGSWSNTSGVIVGGGGTGVLNISGTGAVSSLSGIIGSSAGSSGTATVSSGSWTNTSSLTVGSGGTGVLNILGTGAVSNATGFLASTSGSSGTATVSSGSWTNSGSLTVGSGGTGVLNISGTGVVSSVGGNVGGFAGSSGTAMVSSGSWTNTGSLTVGNISGGTGVLNISGTGAVSNTACVIGGPGGTVTVTGGTWTNAGPITVGNYGTGLLNISGAGAVSGGGGLIGFSAGSIGTVTVSGGSWTNTGELRVGFGGTGVLNVTGGAVSNTLGLIGDAAASSGTATVSSGTWTNSTNLIVGNSGSGVLNITDSGVVHVGGVAGTGTVTLGNTGSGAGTLNLGTGGVAGTLNAASVNGVSGTAVVNFNHTGSLTFATTLGGTLAVNKLGSGMLQLSGVNTYTGDTIVRGGTLKLDLGGSIGSSAKIVVGDAGSTGTHLDVTTKTGGLSIGLAQTLQGIGQVDGNTIILGTHAPGNSPGLQTFNGNLAYSTGAMLNWELATNSVGTRGTDFDGIDVIGAGMLSIASGVTSNLIFNAAGSSVNWANSFWDSNHSWLVYDNANLATHVSAAIFDTINVSQDSLGATLSGGTFAWSEVGNDVFLNFIAPVPEPGTALFGIACAGVAALRRRRRA